MDAIVCYALIQCELSIGYVAALLSMIRKYMAVICADRTAVAHSHIGAVEVCAKPKHLSTLGNNTSRDSTVKGDPSN